MSHRRLIAAAVVVGSLAVTPVAMSAHKFQPMVLALQLWSFPTSWVTSFTETTNQSLGANGWETTYTATGTKGSVIIDSTVVVYPSATQAHAALVTATVPGAKLISNAGGLPTLDSRIFDQRGAGRDKWTVYWRTTRVVASISFDAAYVGKLANFQNAGALATREQKWLAAGGA